MSVRFAVVILESRLPLRAGCRHAKIFTILGMRYPSVAKRKNENLKLVYISGNHGENINEVGLCVRFTMSINGMHNNLV